ncbi:MAG: hypothetical protein CSA25_02130 [Desulfobacter postgatei]|uniref:Uncharacterized protein n=1 Tax=Desulfobacter postgatei TaxID=2293 RepID=A0A2G6MT05_9BACT|nr:MAG: hypothetical protein CSA25_02130 [Desulfobacter postgatei]
MRAISNEKCISEGKLGLQNLFEFVNQNAESMPAYEMEKVTTNPYQSKFGQKRPFGKRPGDCTLYSP